MIYPDLTNQKIGIFTIIAKLPQSCWLCICKCGTKLIVRRSRLYTQTSCKKCPDQGKYKGTSRHYLYKMWRNIYGRCYCKGQTHYRYYGEKGIKMHELWKKDYKAFYTYILETLGERPTAEHTLDRIDSNSDYTPANLRWASKSLQMKNRRIKPHKT